MSKRPSGSQLFAQMMQQQLANMQSQQQAELEQKRLQSQQQSAAEQEAYQQQLQQQRLLAASTVAGQQASIDQGVKNKIGQPVKLGTLLTSPAGLLGNPLLSTTKLSG